MITLRGVREPVANFDFHHAPRHIQTKPEHSIMVESRVVLVFVVPFALGTLYVCSYLFFVTPEPITVYFPTHIQVEHYKYGAHRMDWLYWPIEQIDRRLRPKQWSRLGSK